MALNKLKVDETSIDKLLYTGSELRNIMSLDIVVGENIVDRLITFLGRYADPLLVLELKVNITFIASDQQLNQMSQLLIQFKNVEKLSLVSICQDLDWVASLIFQMNRLSQVMVQSNNPQLENLDSLADALQGRRGITAINLNFNETSISGVDKLGYVLESMNNLVFFQLELLKTKVINIQCLAEGLSQQSQLRDLMLAVQADLRNFDQYLNELDGLQNIKLVGVEREFVLPNFQSKSDAATSSVRYQRKKAEDIMLNQPNIQNESSTQTFVQLQKTEVKTGSPQQSTGAIVLEWVQIIFMMMVTYASIVVFWVVCWQGIKQNFTLAVWIFIGIFLALTAAFIGAWAWGLTKRVELTQRLISEQLKENQQYLLE